MKTEIITIDNTRAAEMLKCNVSNRPLRRARVDALKAAFERGEYVLTHQGIAFDKSGRLTDGQHRLTALAEMPDGFNVQMMMSQGLSDAAFAATDIGKVRSYSDVLREEKRLVEVARFLASLFDTSAVTPVALVPFVEFVRPHHDALLDYCANTAKFFGATSFRSAACVLLAEGEDPDYVKATYRAMVHADFTNMPTSAQVLYRAFLNGSLHATASIDTYARAYRVLHPDNHALKIIKVADASVYTDKTRAFLARAMNTPKKTAPVRTGAVKDFKRGNSIAARA